MTISVSTLFTILAVLFSTTLGCYVYVHKRCAQLQEVITALQITSQSRISALETDLSGKIVDLTLNMTDRLARLDTKMDIMMGFKSKEV